MSSQDLLELRARAQQRAAEAKAAKSAKAQRPGSDLYVQGIGKVKPCLSPVRPRGGLSTRSSGMKGSKSMGQLKRNKISFGDTSTLLFEKDIDDDDEEHKNAVWFSKTEMKSIRKDLKKSIKQGEITRGLEQYEGDMGAGNKEKRLNHIYSILDLQKEQQDKGIQCDKSLQMLSRAMSANDIGRARQLASMDSTQALTEYTNTNSHVIRTSSRLALDNFRKQMDQKSGGGRKGNATFGSSSGTGRSRGGNATFGTNAKKKPVQNLLFQALAKKKQSRSKSPVKTTSNHQLGGVA